MSKPIVLLYNNENHRGPGKVIKNLKLGLDKNNILYGNEEILRKNIDANVGILQTVNSWNEWSSNALLGPNLFVLPSENKILCKRYTKFIVPSEWVLNLYRQFSELDHADINIWTVGIDTDKWSKINRESKNLRCLLYYKNRSKQDLFVVKKILNRYNIEYKELHYGNYLENELIDCCNWANFGILLTNTESQGIAYMEMLSTDLPLFVFNKPTWNYEGTYKDVPATSVPYFDNRCGEIVENINLVKFEEFLDSLKKEKYCPSQYITENYTLEKCSKNYINLF